MKLNKQKILFFSLFFLFNLLFISNSIKISILSENFIEGDFYCKTAQTESGGGYIMDLNAEYSWIEINVTGKELSGIVNADDYYDTITLSFNISFYQNEYDTIYVSSNGWISLTMEYNTFLVREIPGQADENVDIIALLCSDLNLDEFDDGGGTAYYQEFGIAPHRFVVIEYFQVFDFDNEMLVGSFEAILHENGTVIFQYKQVNGLPNFDYLIGLDHGDLTNYNRIEIPLPLTSRAIKFIFDSMQPVSYFFKTLGNQHHIYEVKYVNHSAMGKVLGSEWEKLFGLLPNMIEGQYCKVSTSSRTDNTTHWAIEYIIHNWTSDGSETSLYSNNKLNFYKNPLDYKNKHNLTNLIPFFLPIPTCVYLRNCNLSDGSLAGSYPIYSHFDFYFTQKESIVWAYFSTYPFVLQLTGTYFENGILSEMDFWLMNLDTNGQWAGFELEHSSSLSSSIPSASNGGGNGGSDDDTVIIPMGDFYFAYLIFSILGIIYYMRKKCKIKYN